MVGLRFLITGYCSNLLPELMALKHCLLVAWTRGFEKILCSSDSLETLHLDLVLVLDDNTQHCHLGTLIMNIDRRTFS
jgi:hypothetical protein